MATSPEICHSIAQRVTDSSVVARRLREYYRDFGGATGFQQFFSRTIHSTWESAVVAKLCINQNAYDL
jgi:hypothetical protein